MKMIIPPSVGILVAGVASGICYLLIGSLHRRKSAKSDSCDDSRCACCLKPFLVGRGVECSDCGGRSCRKGCCRWDSLESAWFCLFCYHSRTNAKKKDKWFRNFGGSLESNDCKDFSTAKCRVYDEGAEHVAIHPGLDLAADGRQEGNSMETIREFVEKIVESFVGNVDDTPIDRLYDHPAYDGLFEAYGTILASALTRLAMSLRQCVDNKPGTDTPTMAHTALRELVERAVDEARKLPCLGPTVSTGLQEDSTFSEQNYEDLLATAILNKVIEKFQHERVDGNSNVVHRRIRSKYPSPDNEFGLDEGVEEGSSSLEPLSHDDCSSEGSDSRTRSTRLRREPISLTIEEQIEEVTTTYASDDELRSSKANVLDFRKARRVAFPEFGMDIVDPSQDSSEDSQEETNDLTHVDVVTPVESWEENWLFQKRKIRRPSEPVSMLVPNPSADYRALIGDKDAEDTSDLSEFSGQSDDEIEDEELIEAVNRSVSSEAECNGTINDKISKIMGKIEEPQSIEEIQDNACKLEVDVSEEFESIYRDNIGENFKILEKSNVIEDNGKTLSHLSKCTMRNFLPENVPENLSACDHRRLNEKLIVIDQSNDEDESHLQNGLDRTKLEMKNHTEMIVSPTNVKQQDFKTSTLNGLPKISLQKADEEAVDTVSSCLSNLELKSNGDAKKIDDPPTTQLNSRDHALSNSKILSESEEPSRRKGNDNDMATPPRPGTIAEREHKKWENAAPIENNPYSEENIQKRLLERQYARRSSDVSSNSTKLQTSPSPPIQIILGAGHPDFKRFGRDYYINEAKFPKGRSAERGYYGATSRPNSSMSQNSLSTGSDCEHQERSSSVERGSSCSPWSESRSRMNSGGKNVVDRGNESREISSSDNDDERSEKMRKNNWSPENGSVSFKENGKSIKRIDLGAYGFANESKNAINGGEIDDEKAKRVVKKLDLRSYGYDSGLRRTQSNNSIDLKLKNNFTLGTQKNLEGDKSNRENLSKSNESLSEQDTNLFEQFGGMKSAKSVPNIGQPCSTIRHHSSQLILRNSHEKLSFADKETNGQAIERVDEPAEVKSRGNIRFIENLPSVKRLAEAFDHTEKSLHAAAQRDKSVGKSGKQRPTTPEVHIIDTPRQMHSLTARSISREFREGLRQISSKPTSPDKTVSPKNQDSTISRTNASVSASPGVKTGATVASGKLRSNIKFWEELREKS